MKRAILITHKKEWWSKG